MGRQRGEGCYENRRRGRQRGVMNEQREAGREGSMGEEA